MKGSMASVGIAVLSCVLSCTPRADQEAATQARTLVQAPDAFARMYRDNPLQVKAWIVEMMVDNPEQGVRALRALALRFAAMAGENVRQDLESEHIPLLGKARLPALSPSVRARLFDAGAAIGLAMTALDDAKRRGGFDGRPVAVARDLLAEAEEALDDALDPGGDARSLSEHREEAIHFDELRNSAYGVIIDGIVGADPGNLW